MESGLAAALARIEPGEILLSDKFLQRGSATNIFEPWLEQLTCLPKSRFDSTNGRKRLEDFFGVSTLAAFGPFSREEVSAGGTLVDYVELTQQGSRPRIEPPRRLADGTVMEIDHATRHNLELTMTLSGERRGSLLSVIDQTQTGAGARALAARLAAPLRDLDEIKRRQDSVQHFVDDHTVREAVRNFSFTSHSSPVIA